MNDEAAFLAAIAAAPNDDTLRLVFADWLEEHDDPRGKWSRHHDIRPWMGANFASPIPPILEAIAKDKQVIAARRAVEAIGEPIVPGLIELLKHASQRVRQQACLCLKKLGPRAKAAAPALMELLADPEYSVRGKAAKALRDIGADASADTSKLKAALTDSNWSVRFAASKVLGKMGAKGSVLEELVEKFDSPDEKDRIEAIEGLKHLGTVEVVAHLDIAADDPAVTVRVAAVQALGVLKHATISPILCDRMADASAEVREAAVDQFTGYWRQHFITPDVVTALGDRLADQEVRIRARACYALSNAGALGKPAIPLLIKRLEDDEASVRAAAAGALGVIGTASPDPIPPLLELLIDESEVAGTAANALGKWQELPASVVPGLMAFVRRARTTGNWNMTASSAFRAFGKVAAPPKSVLDALRASIRALDDEYNAAMDAVTNLGPAAAPAVPDLLALLQREQVPHGVVKALTHIGGPAFDALAAILDGPDEEARTRIIQRLWDLGADAAPLVPVLMRVYHRTTNDWHRSNILRAIGRFGPDAAPVIPELLDILETWSGTNGPGEVFHALTFLAPALVPHLPRIAALVGRPNLSGARSSLAFLLANVAQHTADALAPLRAALRDAHIGDGWSRTDARRGVLQGLNKIALLHGPIPDPAELAADLGPLADDSDATTLEGLTMLLGKLGPPGAPLLCRLLVNTLVGIRAKAADELATTSDTSEETLAALVHAIEDREPKVRRAAIDTLNKLKSGTPEVLAALEAAAADTDAKVAERAAVALKKLAPKAPKPAAPRAKGKKKPT